MKIQIRSWNGDSFFRFKNTTLAGMLLLVAFVAACQKDNSNKNPTDKVFNDPSLKALSSEEKIHAAEALIPVKETLLVVKNLGDRTSVSSNFPVTNSLISKIRSECFVVKGTSPGSSRYDHPLDFNLDVHGSAEKQCPVSIAHTTKLSQNNDLALARSGDYMETFTIHSKFLLNPFATPGSSYLKSMDLSDETIVKNTSIETDRTYEKTDVLSMDVESLYFDSYKVFYSSGLVQKSKSNYSEGVYDETTFENWTIHLPDYKAQIKTETRRISSTEVQTRYFFNNREISKTNLDNIYNEAAKRVANY